MYMREISAQKRKSISRSVGDDYERVVFFFFNIYCNLPARHRIVAFRNYWVEK